MNRYKGVSGWAAPFVDEETGEVQPKNVTPSPQQQLNLWHLEQIAKAKERQRLHNQRAGAYAVRALIALIVMLLPFPFWVRFFAGVAFLIAGLIAWFNAEYANMARFEAMQRLD